MSFIKKFGHVMAHVGLGVVQVGLVAGKFIPPPFNLIVSGSAAVASVVIAATHKNTSSAVQTALASAAKTP
jgi:hypothetical protein